MQAWCRLGGSLVASAVVFCSGWYGAGFDGFRIRQMISFITGKPGGGKGLLSMQQHVDELRLGQRPIITSLPVRVDPWVNGAWQPMIGLRNYLRREFKIDFDVEKRVFLLDDEQSAEFYLYRVIDGKLVKADAEYKTTKDGERRIMEYDTHLAAESGPVFYCIDEAWKFWGSRNWQKTGEGMLFYGAQHRHFGDDVLIVTQHTKQIDPAIQRVAQDFWVVRNHGKMSFGMFRQPAVFSVCIYDQAPTGASITPMSRKLFRLDKTGLAQCYDTSAGVGLSGRMMADVGSRAKGLPWWLMLVAVFALLTLVYGVLSFGGHALTHAMSKGGARAAQAVQAGVLKHDPAVHSAFGSAVAVDAVGQAMPGPLEENQNSSEIEQKQYTNIKIPRHGNPWLEQTNSTYCTGYVFLPGRHGLIWPCVALSDGRTAEGGEVEMVGTRQVRVFGQVFPVVRVNPPPPVADDRKPTVGQTSDRPSAINLPLAPVYSPVQAPSRLGTVF